jgi:hypothetical protein
MISPHEAEQVEACGYSAVVKRRAVPSTSTYAASGAAFAAIVDENCPPEEVTQRLALLTDAEQREVRDLAVLYLKYTPRGQGAISEHKFALLPSGELCDWEDPNRITRGKIDAWWEEPGLVVVRDDKKGFLLVSHPADNLQLGVYAKALLQIPGLPWGVKCRAEIANPTKEPPGRLVQHVYGPGEIDALWQRFLRADLKASGPKVLAEPGPACSVCWQRQQCDARLLPAMMGEPGDLAPFSKGDPGIQTHEQALKGLLLIEAMDEVVDRAKEQLKAWTTVNGPIRSGDKAWKGWEAAGKRSGPTLDELEKRGLGDLIKSGKPGVRFEWRRSKEKP